MPMSRSFEFTIPRVTLPKVETPWRNGALIANSLKSRIPVQKQTSKLPMLVGAAIIILVLLIVAIGVKKMRGSSSPEVHTMEARLDESPVLADSKVG